MAPKRGGGSSGGSSGGLESSCSGAFQDSYFTGFSTPIVYFAGYCLFFVLTLVITISLCCIRKRHGNAKKLAGPIFLVSLLGLLLGYALEVIATLLRECRTIAFSDYYSFVLVYIILFSLSNWLLLVVVLWSVNSLLRERLDSGRGVLKIISMVVLGFMAALTCAYVGLTCYNVWLNTPTGARSTADALVSEQNKLGLAYCIFYLLSVMAAGAIAVTTLLQMRSKKMSLGSLLGWVITLYVSMSFWSLLNVVEFAYSVEDKSMTQTAYEALAYLSNLFTIVTFVAILFLAKSSAWHGPVVDNGPPVGYAVQPVQYAPMPMPQQQYAYQGQPVQQYYYQQQPVYTAVPYPPNGGQPVIAK